MKCTATSKRTHERCGANAVTGRTVCHHHGGRSPAGIASATYKHGGRSRYLPTALMARFAESRTDPELLDLSVDLATIEARIGQVLGRVESGEAGALWEQMGEAHAAFQAAQRVKDTQAMGEAMQELGAAIKRGRADWAAWGEVLNLIERRRKLVESEAKRRVQMQAVMDTERVLQIADFLARSVKTHVRDPDAIRAISADLGTLFSGSAALRDGESAG